MLSTLLCSLGLLIHLYLFVLKAENMAEKLEWMSKLRWCIGSTKGSIEGGSGPEFDCSRCFNPLEIPIVCPNFELASNIIL
jgi:hypothetical protein